MAGLQQSADPNSDSALQNFDFDSFLNPSSNEGFSASRSSYSAAPSSSAPLGHASAAPNPFGSAQSSASAHFNAAAPSPPNLSSPEDLLHHLIALQTFEGSWEWSPSLFATLKIDEARIRQIMPGPNGANGAQLATAIVIAVFEERLAAYKGSWELVVDKARGWLGVDEMVEEARRVVREG